MIKNHMVVDNHRAPAKLTRQHLRHQTQHGKSLCIDATQKCINCAASLIHSCKKLADLAEAVERASCVKRDEGTEGSERAAGSACQEICAKSVGNKAAEGGLGVDAVRLKRVVVWGRGFSTASQEATFVNAIQVRQGFLDVWYEIGWLKHMVMVWGRAFSLHPRRKPL